MSDLLTKALADADRSYYAAKASVADVSSLAIIVVRVRLRDRRCRGG